MTLEQSILLIISFTLTITSMTIIGYNSKDISDLKREISRLKDELHKAPTADVQPVKHGRWKAHGSLPTNQWSCSECRGLVEVAHYCNECYYDFCPRCGAKMDDNEVE